MPRHPSPASAAIRSVACPLCGAKPGRRCVPVKPAASWTAGQPAADHKARRDLAAATPADDPWIPPENPAPVTEHAIEMSSGDMKVRNHDPEIERTYPLDEWITHNQRFGGKVWKRRIIVVEDWEEVPRA